jgi:hypothetical protein
VGPTPERARREEASPPAVGLLPSPSAPGPSTPAPVPPTTAPPPPVGLAFAVGARIPLGDVVVGPLTLLHATFKAPLGQLQAEVTMHCAKGHDQKVAVRVDILDAAGQTLLTLNGSGEVEEKDNGTVKIKQRVAEGLLASAAFFRVQVSSSQ